MIPKRAIFFWEGHEMSWLRKQSLETFRLCNPDWEIVLIDGDGLPIKKNGLLSIVHRSDWARYRELHERGGFYFDTDIVFYGPVPEEWLDSQLVLPVTDTGDGHVSHIAAMGCSAGEPFFRDICTICDQLVSGGKFLKYQALGVEAINRAKSVLVGRDVRWIDGDALVPIGWNDTHLLWNDSLTPLPTLTFGVHWFGGDHLSRHVEGGVSEDWVCSSNCIVARAVRKARGVS